MKKSRSVLGILIIAAIVFFVFKGCRDKVPDRAISLDSARTQVRGYQRLLANPADSNLNQARLRSLYYQAHIFSKKDLEAILSQKDCDGIRIFHGLDSLSGRSLLLIVGVTDAGSGYQNLLPNREKSFGSGARNEMYSEHYDILSDDPNIRCEPICDKGLE